MEIENRQSNSNNKRNSPQKISLKAIRKSHYQSQKNQQQNNDYCDNDNDNQYDFSTRKRSSSKSKSKKLGSAAKIIGKAVIEYLKDPISEKQPKRKSSVKKLSQNNNIMSLQNSQNDISMSMNESNNTSMMEDNQFNNNKKSDVSNQSQQQFMNNPFFQDMQNMCVNVDKYFTVRGTGKDNQKFQGGFQQQNKVFFETNQQSDFKNKQKQF